LTQPGPSEPRSARCCPQGIVSVSPCKARGKILVDAFLPERCRRETVQNVSDVRQWRSSCFSEGIADVSGTTRSVRSIRLLWGNGSGLQALNNVESERD